MTKEPIISVKNLVAKYDEKIILDGVSVDIYPQEVTVILGGSGCGKTTLLKNILRLFQPYSGKVEIFGTEVTQLDEVEFDEILSRVGMLFQNGALLNSVNIFENVSIPLEQHTKLSSEIIEKIIRVKLNLVNLGHAINLFPSELSGGMKKRAALARAIAMDPEILFCDEPSAGLDPMTSASLDELILKLKNLLKMTIVIVTHELASIHRIADKIIFLDDGKVLFTGTLKEALKCKVPEVEKFFEVGKF
ncbi:MAG: ATP-binding cassette domain-containing protein [Candidatus Cloacimonetes bacterium]|nr:ATP-binding cassette domain-containing protein [Candidatus Cloacimonadota bacterium]MCF7815326.1 ATP-binding cassette domain-containing protein [Candidatus Cloacimonadota bacterium]MCF7883313.1 ATP-binding cassette domain-containing protein [Candidatus Cloacimonadota bacterium]